MPLSTEKLNEALRAYEPQMRCELLSGICFRFFLRHGRWPEGAFTNAHGRLTTDELLTECGA